MKQILSVIVFVLLLTSCDRTNNNPGYDFSPDMFYSRAYETFSEDTDFRDGMTMREPVEGTVPRGIVPYPYAKTDSDRLLAGKELMNPLKADSANLVRGKEAFSIFCSQCHGPKADGKGFLFTSGLYAFKPATLVNEKMKTAPDGEIYHVITVGQGVMQAHGSIIRPEDRWKIVLYVRQLQVEAGDTIQ